MTNNTNTIDDDYIHAVSTTTAITTIIPMTDDGYMIYNITNNTIDTDDIYITGITTNIILQHHDI